LTFRFIADHQDEWPVRWMCGALEVSASAYSAWAARPDSPTEQWRRELVGAIEEVHAEVKGRYGSPRMAAELKARGYECSENTVAELMREHGIRAKTPRRFVRTTDSNHRLPVAPNILDRDFEPSGPNESWCADITYIPTGQGWLDLAVVEDLFSRMIVGWAMAATMTSGWWSMPWRWRSAAGSRARAWWPTRTGAASTPATTTGVCSAATGLPAA
jgi:transposase InsO family protein